MKLVRVPIGVVEAEKSAPGKRFFQQKKMKKPLASAIAGALIFCGACCAFADLRPPYFYQVTVTLIDGTTITGASYGLLGFFGSRLSSSPVRSVVLSHTTGNIQGHVTFYGNPETKTYKRSGNGLRVP